MGKKIIEIISSQALKFRQTIQENTQKNKPPQLALHCSSLRQAKNQEHLSLYLMNLNIKAHILAKKKDDP
jgi:hypothetical protein